MGDLNYIICYNDLCKYHSNGKCRYYQTGNCVEIDIKNANPVCISYVEE